ncbi:MAG: serine hydrolase [Solirubrobacteraceae bacterium]
MRYGRLVVLTIVAFSPTAVALAALVGPKLSTRATPASVQRGGTTTISGTLLAPSGPVVGVHLELQRQNRRTGHFGNLAATVTGPAGRYVFANIRVLADTHFRVMSLAPGGPIGPVIEVKALRRPYPSSRHVIEAAKYVGTRSGRDAFAVIDDRGRLAGVGVDQRFHSASTVKAMLLVADLRMLASENRPLDGASQALLYPMIHSSDNTAASAVLGIVGEGALDRVARDAHMRDYESGGAFWGFTEVSASDLARLFFHLDGLIPRRFVGYARWLLSTIEASESWGIPAAARPRFEVFFKGGWLPEVEGLVNQAARLEASHVVLAIAVMTTGDPSMAYGEETIAGVTARLLGPGA